MRKNYIMLLIVAGISGTFIGCGASNIQKPITTVVEEQSDDLPEVAILDIDTYSAVVRDTVWRYEGNSYLESETVWIDYIKEDLFQVRVRNVKGTTAKVYQQDEHALYEVATIENAVTKRDYTGVKQYKRVVFQLPLEAGRSWLAEEGVMRKIVSMDEMVALETGEVATMKLVTQKGGYKLEEYYSPDLGLVKKVESNGKEKNEFLLISHETNEPVEERVEVFLLDEEQEKLVSMIVPVPIRTNEEPRHFFTDILRKPLNNQSISALPQGITIERIYLQKEKNSVQIDLTRDYDESMYSPALKELALQSVANTIGEYYDVSEITIAIAGKVQRVYH